MTRFSLYLFLFTTSCQQDYEVIPKPVDVDPGEVTECGFTNVYGDFYEYDCNPVFETSGESWAPTIRSTAFNVTPVLGHPFYQLWYVGAPTESSTKDWALGYAASADGTNWTANTANPIIEDEIGAWNASGMEGMHLVWDADANQYLMIYQGYNVLSNPTSWGMGVATSPDGQNWTQASTNPVFDLLQPLGNVKGWCWPLGLSLGNVGGYTGYLAGYTKDDPIDMDSPCEMYSISSTDGLNWTPSTNLVFKAGSSGSWDDQGMISMDIAYLDNTWYMFYVGFGEWISQGSYKSSSKQFLGMATSGDGLTWTKQPDYIPINKTIKGEIGSVAAHTVGNRIHLWITDQYDDISAVGYFLYDPNRTETDTGEGG